MPSLRMTIEGIVIVDREIKSSQMTSPRRQHTLGIILIAILILLFILARSFRLISWRPY